jgi:hypothetical protein
LQTYASNSRPCSLPRSHPRGCFCIRLPLFTAGCFGFLVFWGAQGGGTVKLEGGFVDIP